MSTEITVNLNATAFRPGERIIGQAAWQLVRPPRKARIRLFWRTEGKGSEDLRIVEERAITNPRTTQIVDFAFDLPVMPYSYRGALLSIRWGVEAVVDRASGCAWFEMGPDGQPCRAVGLQTGNEP